MSLGDSVRVCVSGGVGVFAWVFVCTSMPVWASDSERVCVFPPLGNSAWFETFRQK